MKRLGVTTARLFGGSGGISPRKAFASTFGQDLNGAAVTSRATFTAAVADLRSPAGHSNASGTRANPVAYSVYDAALASPTPTDPGGSSVDRTVATLWAAGIEPLVVQWAPCNQFNFTSFDATTGVYWGERWELYKQQARTGTCSPAAFIPPRPSQHPSAAVRARALGVAALRAAAGVLERGADGWGTSRNRNFLSAQVETPQASDSPADRRSRTSTRRAST